MSNPYQKIDRLRCELDNAMRNWNDGVAAELSIAIETIVWRPIAEAEKGREYLFKGKSLFVGVIEDTLVFGTQFMSNNQMMIDPPTHFAEVKGPKP